MARYKVRMHYWAGERTKFSTEIEVEARDEKNAADVAELHAEEITTKWLEEDWEEDLDDDLEIDSIEKLDN